MAMTTAPITAIGIVWRWNSATPASVAANRTNSTGTPAIVGPANATFAASASAGTMDKVTPTASRLDPGMWLSPLRRFFLSVGCSDDDVHAIGPVRSQYDGLF